MRVGDKRAPFTTLRQIALAALVAAIAIGCGTASSDDEQDLGVASCYLSNTPPCCPNQNPVNGFPSGPCSPNGATCTPGSTDVRCTCEVGAWQCRAVPPVNDLSRSLTD